NKFAFKSKDSSILKVSSVLPVKTPRRLAYHVEASKGDYGISLVSGIGSIRLFSTHQVQLASIQYLHEFSTDDTAIGAWTSLTKSLTRITPHQWLDESWSFEIKTPSSGPLLKLNLRSFVTNELDLEHNQNQ